MRIKITAAVVMAGGIISEPGTVADVSDAIARQLIADGKAVEHQSDDEVEEKPRVKVKK